MGAPTLTGKVTGSYNSPVLMLSSARIRGEEEGRVVCCLLDC